MKVLIAILVIALVAFTVISLARWYFHGEDRLTRKQRREIRAERAQLELDREKHKHRQELEKYIFDSDNDKWKDIT